MKLTDLLPANTKLAEAPHYARGIVFRRWRMLDLEKQCSEWMARQDQAVAPLSGKAEQTKRDRYGWRGQAGTSFLGNTDSKG